VQPASFPQRLAVYAAGGRQFVVVCAEGSKGRANDPKGSQYIAFALPER
jgi:hypothetical protein